MHVPFIAPQCEILTIAGSDPSGGAGLQADLKVISALGGHGWSVMTAVSAQNTQGVHHVWPMDATIIQKQCEAVFQDSQLAAIKVGMLATEANVYALEKCLTQQKKSRNMPVVVDPVCISSSGHILLSSAGRYALLDRLAQRTDLLTPNLLEARQLACDLAGPSVQQASVSEWGNILLTRFPAVLIKGGHGSGQMLIDRLYVREHTDVREWTTQRLNRRNTHGTGCTLSSALACYLGEGHSLDTSIGFARAYLGNALYHADTYQIGQGRGGLRHFYQHFNQGVE